VDDIAADAQTFTQVTSTDDGLGSVDAHASRRQSIWRRNWSVRAGYLIALLPALQIVRRVHKAVLMPFADYWPAFLRITNPDGSLHVRGLFTYQNEHPFFVPYVVYYANARFLDGTNRGLGYYAVVVSAIVVVLLSLMLPRQWSPLARAWLTAAISAIVFCESGLWNFVRGMSGAAWLSANVFAVTAVLLASRRRTVPAVLCAVLAVCSYGTGFGALVAITVIALLRKDRWWRWALPGGMLVIGGIVYEMTSQGGTAGGTTRAPSLLASTMLSNLGMLWDTSAGPLATFAGAVGLMVLLVSIWGVWHRDDLADLIPWWGVATYSVGAAGLISLARSEVFSGNGVQSRYASLSALFWIATTIIALRMVLSTRGLPVRIGAVAFTVVLFYAESPPLADRATSEDQEQKLQAVEARLGIASSSQRMYQPDQQIPRLKALGDYPFDSKFSLGCGKQPGDAIDPTKVRTLPNNAAGVYSNFDSDALTARTRDMRGWVRRPGQKPGCVLIIDHTGKVVGGGATRFARPDVVALNPSFPADTGFEAAAPSSQSDATLVLGYDDGFWKLPER
jgi:hypothetical protein